MNHLETYIIKLTTLSPVFIGGGDSLKGIETEEDFRNRVLKNNPEKIEKWIDYFLNFSEYKRDRDRRIPYDAKNPSLSGF